LEGVVQPTFVLDERRDKIAAAPRSAPDVPVEMHDLMYVIYTSGSTGKPKGVMVEHRNVANFLVGMRERIGLLRGGVWLSATSVSFDISVLEIFGSLTHGFTLVLMGETQFGVASKEAYSLAAQLERHTVSHFQCTPSQALLLLADPEAKQALRHVQEMLIGGEALGLDLAKQLTACLGGRLINVYGPTETTIWSTTFEVPREPADVSLGTPIANTTLYVLDESLEPVPVGVAGELYIGGLGVARGYLRRDELTRERFLPDPFAPTPGARMYKTGDLVRLRNDGSLAFLGRNDFQVKIRGFRVELGEIENALRSLAHAKHAVVVAHNDGKGDARLVAYYVPTEKTPGDLRSLREALQAELPEYMLPSVAVPLSELPLTGSGKVDRNRLPKPESTVSAATAFVAPSSELEQKLAECWKRVLKVDRVGIDDNFFDLGGHSLLMMRLASEITQHCGVSVNIPDLFQAPNIRSLARKLTAQDAGPQAKVGAQAGAARREAMRAVRGRRG
jgi:amino acid adenylation domain-containing protein